MPACAKPSTHSRFHARARRAAARRGRARQRRRLRPRRHDGDGPHHAAAAAGHARAARLLASRLHAHHECARAVSRSSTRATPMSAVSCRSPTTSARGSTRCGPSRARRAAAVRPPRRRLRFHAAGWQDSLHFMEANLSGVGGIHLGPLAETLVMRDIVPTLLSHDPALAIELPRDQRDLFIQILIDHARSLGCHGRNLCAHRTEIRPKRPERAIAWSSTTARRHGIELTHADPRELGSSRRRGLLRRRCVDVAYRDYEVRDILDLEHELGKPLDAMRQLFKQNRMVSSLVGDFDHKSCWEILTDALAERYFSLEEPPLPPPRAVDAHRRRRRTTTPHGPRRPPRIPSRTPRGTGDEAEPLLRRRGVTSAPPHRSAIGRS